MKTVLVLLISFFAFGFHTQEASAQSSKVDTIALHVPGVCNMCKARIETAGYDVPGVKSVKWDLETEILTAIVVRKKTSKQGIADALAKAGYRSELADADPVAYQNLPGCCQYDSGVEKHGNK